MSRWLPDSLRVDLAPDSLVLSRQAHRLNFRARRGPPAAGHLVPVPAGGDEAPPWQNSLAALAETIAAMSTRELRPAGATVVLSNHFVRYALAPWSDLVDSDEEEEAVSRHALRQTFGAAADHWELRVDGTPGGATRLVSAVEPGLLAQLRELFAGAGIRLASVQPRLMAVCNAHRRSLGRRDAWLALAEPGALCLALLRGGRFVRLRHLRLGDAWPAELVTALERETFIADEEPATRDVLVAATPGADLRFPADLPWNIRLLEAPAPLESAPAGG